MVADKESRLRRSSMRGRTTRRAMSRSKSPSGGTLKMSSLDLAVRQASIWFGVTKRAGSVEFEIQCAAAERRLDRD